MRTGNIGPLGAIRKVCGAVPLRLHVVEATVVGGKYLIGETPGVILAIGRERHTGKIVCVRWCKDTSLEVAFKDGRIYSVHVPDLVVSAAEVDLEMDALDAERASDSGEPPPGRPALAAVDATGDAGDDGGGPSPDAEGPARGDPPDEDPGAGTPPVEGPLRPQVPDDDCDGGEGGEP